MLRQLFRTRGAYNVVNLPVAASQDDPGSNSGRADHSPDWRQKSSLAQFESSQFDSDQLCESLSTAVHLIFRKAALRFDSLTTQIHDDCLRSHFCSGAVAEAQLVCRQVPELSCRSQDPEEKARKFWTPK